MLSDISRLLKQRGHEVTKEGADRDLLLPTLQTAEMTAAFKEILYGLMRRDSFRRGLRDWAYGKEPTAASPSPVVDGFMSLCTSLPHPWKDSADAIQHRYSATFEWYVSELVKREFAARASGFGLRLKDADPDDEFDCVALLDKGLVFVECKTGKGDLYEEVKKFVRRDRELAADYSLFVYDREYTFKRGENDLPDLTREKATTLGIDTIGRVTGAKHSFFVIEGEDRYFLASPALKGFEERIRYMIRYMNHFNDNVLLNRPGFDAPGFSYERISFA